MRRSFRATAPRCFVLSILGLAAACAPAAVDRGSDLSSLLTAAERSDFEQTTRYDEVVELMEAFDAASDRLHMTTFGYSYEGRPLPMMVVGDVADADPASVRNSGKTRVWVQGNIHAGEVCGKEAMLMMLRDLAAGEHAGWDDSVVLLIAPIYNADGNELVRVDNRGSQNGPFAGMGQRPNAQGYDLNRNHMKLDSPEARSLVQMMNEYDPHVLVDLHTTNGTRHAYHVTYSAPMHPATHRRIDEVLRDDWLLHVTQAIKDKHGWDYYYYGNVGGGGSRGGRRGGPDATTSGGGRGGQGGRRGAERAGIQRTPVWQTFDYRPRFNNNYVGLRNRFAVLSEAYAYATFEARILASLYFVEEIIEYAEANAQLIRDVVAEAEGHSIAGEELAVRAVPKRSEEQVRILMGATERVLNPYSGRYVNQRLDVVEPLGEELTLQLERFMITSSTVAPREFQGHTERTVEGAWETTEATLPADTLVVLTDQPLGRLAFVLLEPRSSDGLTNWNFLDQALDGAQMFPIMRTRQEFRSGR